MSDGGVSGSGGAPATSSQKPGLPPRSGSIVLQRSVSSYSHVNVCRPWISWKKGNIAEYVSKPRVFFDHLHQQIVLFTGSPPNKIWFSDRATQTWMDYPLHLPPHNDIIGAQFSPDRTHVALRVSDKEVKVLSTATGEVVTARSCRGTSSRMISVHWLNDPALSKNAAAASLFLLFVTNAGVELYELTSDKPLLPTAASTALALAGTKNKLKHIKTATYNIVYHWILLDENILLLVDARNVFQAYKLSSKSISKLCKFELDCAGTSLNPPPHATFQREQICLSWLYGRMVILFINEVKGQLHLLSLANNSSATTGASASASSSDDMEQSHVFDLYQPHTRYDVSVLDNVLVVHNSAARVTLLFDVRSESKTTITEPLPIGPPLSTTVVSNGGDAATRSQGGAGAGAGAGLGMASLAPANFNPYVKWTFLAPQFVWESTGDQQQGNLWTLQLNLAQIAHSWPSSKRARLVDFLLKRGSVQAKSLILDIIYNIVTKEPSTSLALLSRLFSLLNRMNYDNRMNPQVVAAASSSMGGAPNMLQPVQLDQLPLLPPFASAVNSAASTANNSQAASPAPAGHHSSSIVRPSPSMPTHSVSPYANLARMSISGTHSAASTTTNSPLAAGVLPSFGSRLTSPQHVRSSSSLATTSASVSTTSSFAIPSHMSSAAAAAGDQFGTPGPSSSSSFSDSTPSSSATADDVSYALDDTISVLSCEMLDHPSLWSMPLTLEHNLHGYMLVSQLDLYTHVFSRARHGGSSERVPPSQIIPPLVEFIRSTHRHFLKVDDLLNDMLVSLLLECGRLFELHQYLQYHILNDSLPIANRLILQAPRYPAAYQLGLDMLYRLNALPRLLQVLLQHGQVLTALQLIPSFRAPFLEGEIGAGGGGSGGVGLFPRDFLQVALNSGDDIVFYHTFRFFEARNVALRGSATFLAGDACEQFVARFHQLFGGNLMAEAAAIAAGVPVIGNAAAAAAAALPSAAGGRASFSATGPGIVAGTGAVNGGSRVPGVPWPRPTPQFYNLGDEDDSDGEDGDIEYEGDKPDPYAPPSKRSDSPGADTEKEGAGVGEEAARSRSQSRSRTRSRAPSSATKASGAAAGAAGGSGEGDDGAGDLSSGSELVHLPSPLDLSTHIPSVGFSEEAANEDAAAESGLGATMSKQQRARQQAEAVSPEHASVPGIDGSFGGLSTPAADAPVTPATSAAFKATKRLSGLFQKNTLKFQAEPAM